MRRALAGGWIALACASFAPAQQFPPPTPAPLPAASASPVQPATPAANPANSGAVAPAEPAVLATRQTTFTIPFHVDARGGASEVQLHVSGDRGKTWQVASRQRPEAGQFLFRAAEDGEYWFASRTLDAQGRSAPGPLTPELRVRVDTASPKTDLEARVGASGEIIAAWEAADDDLVQESVSLEYQAAGDQRWQTVVLDPDKVKREGTAYSGEASWFPTTNHRAINLRIVARDGAGNIAVLNRGVYLPRPPARAGDSQSPAPLGADPFRRDDVKVSNKPPEPWPAENERAAPTSEPPRVADALPTYQSVAAPIASAVANRAEVTPLERPPVRSFAPAPVGPAVPADLPRSPANGPRSPADVPRSPADLPANIPPAPAAHPASPAPYAAPEPQPADLDPTRDDLPSGVVPNFTTNKRFKLDYDTENIPQQDLAAVELWGTHDGGRTWLKWGIDSDRQSPFEVVVDDEGAFGFRIVLVHRNGMAGHTPREGDAADIWVGVDTTLPVARLGNVAYGKGANSGQLEIEWTAGDAWLASRPVSLSFASDPQGPWTPLAEQLANTGRYFWRVPPSVPRRIYLKLEVRDAAGNLAEDRLTNVLELDGLAPHGRIKGLEE